MLATPVVNKLSTYMCRTRVVVPRSVFFGRVRGDCTSTKIRLAVKQAKSASINDEAGKHVGEKTLEVGHGRTQANVGPTPYSASFRAPACEACKCYRVTSLGFL